MYIPLAERARPRCLDEISGQSHILAPGKLLRNLIESKKIINMIFYGPPGLGKTTVAKIAAEHSKMSFKIFNCTSVTSAEIKETIDNREVDVYTKGGSGGKLFGSVTPQDVSDAIYRTFEITIDKKKIKLSLEGIKTVDSFGTYPYKVKLHKDVVASIRVNVKELTEEIKEMLKKQDKEHAHKILS